VRAGGLRPLAVQALKPVTLVLRTLTVMSRAGTEDERFAMGVRAVFGKAVTARVMAGFQGPLKNTARTK
jgi:hypothetical protein